MLAQSFDTALLVNKSKSDSVRKRLKQEYNQLFEWKIENGTSIGRMNRSKNRYSNVLPTETTRVQLKGLKNDYINANIISPINSTDDHTNENISYISTQAPLPNTCRDFWKMVWDQQTSVVMMLTDFKEGNPSRTKAHQYWSSKHPSTFIYTPSETLDEIETNLMAELEVSIELECGTLNIFNLTNGKGTRRIYHIHYKDWGDHKEPSSLNDIKNLVDYMNVFHSIGLLNGLDGPPIIHCSAGIGRTGTFISCAIVKALYLHREEVNIPYIVKTLRECRDGMVQTDDQYVFIYQFYQSLSHLSE